MISHSGTRPSHPIDLSPHTRVLYSVKPTYQSTRQLISLLHHPPTARIAHHASSGHHGIRTAGEPHRGHSRSPTRIIYGFQAITHPPRCGLIAFLPPPACWDRLLRWSSPVCLCFRGRRARLTLSLRNSVPVSPVLPGSLLRAASERLADAAHAVAQRAFSSI